MLITLHSSLHHDNTEHNQPWVPRMTFQCLLWDKHSTNTSLSLRLRSPPNSTLCVAGWALISSKHLFSCSFLSSAKSLVLSRWEVIREKATPLIWHWNENIVWLSNWYLSLHPEIIVAQLSSIIHTAYNSHISKEQAEILYSNQVITFCVQDLFLINFYKKLFTWLLVFQKMYLLHGVSGKECTGLRDYLWK